ncbi:NUDIX hydrolase [Chitinophaga rhizophila]|uniref:NUDIX domain-containing protein n=1 Tax=Chitinophaga rhizophila TaxID=2866212 RepID=A0ABS7G5G5_9BACT|nr:NUDIX domain-containing protein [Chitinophaga rhizophila]MBW8682902.1 NUDIX domain-containing protein [Chitinophaga rhizophila]
MTALKTVGLLIVRDKKLLLAYSRNKQCFYLPGGKVDEGETEKEALCREIAEELNVEVTADELEYYTHISAPAFGEQQGVIMEQDCYWLHRDVTPRPAAEIGAIHFFSSDDYSRQEAQAPGVIAILNQLKADGFVD